MQLNSDSMNHGNFEHETRIESCFMSRTFISDLLVLFLLFGAGHQNT